MNDYVTRKEFESLKKRFTMMGENLDKCTSALNKQQSIILKLTMLCEKMNDMISVDKGRNNQ